MAGIYIEDTGILFSLDESGNRIISSNISRDSLTGLIYTEKCKYKSYPNNAEKIAQKAYKDKSYIIDNDIVYYYDVKELSYYKQAIVSPYQILILKFLENKNIAGNVLVLDGTKDAVIISLIIDSEVSITISGALTINESIADITQQLKRDKIKLDKIVINDNFYYSMFHNTPIVSIEQNEILEFAGNFKAPVFQEIENIRKKIAVAKNKNINIFLGFSVFIFLLSLAGYFYTSKIYNQYVMRNRNLNTQLISVKQKLNMEIEKKFLTSVRINDSKKLKFVLLKVNTVKNIYIKKININKKSLIIDGNIPGGYRSFVRGFNNLKMIMKSINYQTNYLVTMTGQTGFIVTGAI
jgi:hypothetical protein